MSAPGSGPRRAPLVVGNWKMNKTNPEAVALVRELLPALLPTPPCEVVLCPPITALTEVSLLLAGTPVRLGAQNLHWEAGGAFTGEVSGAMLAALGCQFVIVGHSERRHGMGEDDALVAQKLRSAQRDGLTPIVCMGETLAEREAERTAEVLVRQAQAAYEGLDQAQSLSTVVAYEPVWAIGTGRVATVEQAREAHQMLRATLDRVVGLGTGARISILYGGSVNAANAAAMFADEELDGALVGGAALEAASFWRIVAAAS